MSKSVHIGEFRTLPLSQVDPDSYPNIRRTAFTPHDESIRRLAKTLADNGMVHPVLVRLKSSQTIERQYAGECPGDPAKPYEVLAGFRRTLAMLCLRLEAINETSKSEDFDTLPVHLVKANDKTARLLTCIENTTVLPLEPREEILMILEFLDSDMSNTDIASSLGVSRTWVGERASFGQHASHKLREAVYQGHIGFKPAYALYVKAGGYKSSEKDRKLQDKAAEAALKEYQAFQGKSDRKRLQAASKAAKAVVARATATVKRSLHSAFLGRASSIVRTIGYKDVVSDYERGVQDAYLALFGEDPSDEFSRLIED